MTKYFPQLFMIDPDLSCLCFFKPGLFKNLEEKFSFRLDNNWNHIFSSFYVLKLLEIFWGLNQDWILLVFIINTESDPLVYEFKFGTNESSENISWLITTVNRIVKRFKCNFIKFLTTLWIRTALTLLMLRVQMCQYLL